MKINELAAASENPALRKPTQDSLPEVRTGSPSKPNPEARVAENRPPPKPAQPTPRLIANLRQSLTDTGLSVPGSTAVPGTTASDEIGAGNDLERGQIEKRAEALQAFAHSLIQAVNEPRQERLASSGQPDLNPAARSDDGARLPNPSPPYEGLISRLETLVRELEAGKAPGESSPALDSLRSAFDDLAPDRAAGDSSSGASDLRSVLRALTRNLQSSGDPTLASTGNIINTAA